MCYAFGSYVFSVGSEQRRVRWGSYFLSLIYFNWFYFILEIFGVLKISDFRSVGAFVLYKH